MDNNLPLHLSLAPAVSARLRLDRSSLLWVHGAAGVGKSSRLAAALTGWDVAWIECRAHDDVAVRRQVANYLGQEGDPPGWRELLRRVESQPGPRVWVLDDADDLLTGGGRVGREMGEFWQRLARSRDPRLLVLMGRGRGWLDRLRGEGSSFRDPRPPLVLPPGHDLRPGSVAEVRALDPPAIRSKHTGDGVADVLRCWCTLGGLPRVLRHLEPGKSVMESIRHLVLDPHGVLHREPLHRLQEDFQGPGRYLAVLRALAHGARSWGEVVKMGGPFTTSAAVAPYMSRLEELGWVDSQRPLDAPPGARRRRYRVADPFVEFWLRAVLPHLGRFRFAGAGWVDDGRLEEWMEDATQRNLGRAVEEILLHREIPGVGFKAREVGGIWGANHSIGLAGTLLSGAPFYGVTRWRGDPLDVLHLDALERNMDETRYGFGRERRVRIMVSGCSFTSELVRLARTGDDLVLVEATQLFG
ncbi:MAG: hypothetical protein WEA09_08360 [Gemmatimonadota bacterium]